MKVLIPVSVGELIDRLTILELKSGHAPDETVRASLDSQIEAYTAAARAVPDDRGKFGRLRDELAGINAELWDIEDKIRHLDRLEDLGEEFVALARSVHRLNDHRSAVKKRIDRLTGSEFEEHKIYATRGPSD